MTHEIRELQLENGTRIWVEVDPVDVAPVAAGPGDEAPTGFLSGDLPPGAEPTGIRAKTQTAMSLFQETIATMATTVRDSLEEVAPDKWTVEMNIGFKGKTSPIPFIATGEMTGGVKVIATWEKQK